MERILENKIRCKRCGDVIESKDSHDYVTCKCGCCGVDGGKDYLRRTFMYSQDDYEELSVCEDVQDSGK